MQPDVYGMLIKDLNIHFAQTLVCAKKGGNEILIMTDPEHLRLVTLWSLACLLVETVKLILMNNVSLQLVQILLITAMNLATVKKDGISTMILTLIK